LTKPILRRLPTAVTEVRLRRRRPLIYLTSRGRTISEYIISDTEFETVLSLVTEHSLYAITEKLVNGYIPLRGGLRVGVAGEGVMDGDRVKTIKHITSLSLRIPHQIFGIADFLHIDGYFDQNLLIVSPPGAGKTTLLREITRKLSECGKCVTVLDERGEISGACGNEFALDVGANTDVLFGFPKKLSYENALRALSPEYIVTDELSGERDVEGVMRAFYGGVRVIATLHGGTLDVFHGAFATLKDVFDRLILLSKVPRVGTVKEDIGR
ncbi:MAG: stage III sporulation protein AA, partial [Clostridia bacterium]|nr:stage III sporulation protein AA [Clostridia bacterium]